MEKTALAAMYELFALAFTCPDEEFCGLLSSGEYEEALCEIAGINGIEETLIDDASHCLGELKGQDPLAIRRPLRIDYTALFVGAPYPLVPLSEGIWKATERGDKARMMMINNTTMGIEQFMKSCGIFAAEDNRDCIDNLYSECEFMQYLALTESFPNDFEMTPQEAFKTFFVDYFATWVPNVCNKIIEVAEQDFYRVMAGLLKGFVLVQATALKPLDESVM